MAITRSSISPSPSGSKRKDVGDEEGNVRKMSLGDDKSDDSVSRDVVNERRSKKSNDPVSKDVVNEKSKKINEKVAESVKKSSVSSLAKKKSRVPDIVPDDRKSKKLKLKSVAEVDEGDLDSEDESSIAIPSKAKLSVTPVFPSAEENEKFDLTGFNFSYFSLSDDDFESVKVPKRQLRQG
ncbi:hypothetical protein CsatA_028418 [Cannabis sativa]